jgi:hypothetical protein
MYVCMCVRVCMYTYIHIHRNWNLLKTGGKLVDAPGVRDDNNARDKVVKEYLREADGIWYLSMCKSMFVCHCVYVYVPRYIYNHMHMYVNAHTHQHTYGI